MTSPNTDIAGRTHLNSLDGLRALMAIWVVLGHLSYAVNFSFPVISTPAKAVDIFMVLTGFLMVHTWKGDVFSRRISLRVAVNFWCSRLFRLAPAFYFLLIVAFLVLGPLTQMHNDASRALPPPWITNAATYDPDPHWNFSNPTWIVSHLTFVFGMIPGMENSSPIPEWSLSLEMQFYMLLPILMLLFVRVPFIVLAIVFAALALVSPKLFGNYLEPGFLANFSQPSHLLYRLNAFAAGMILSFWLKAGGRQRLSRGAMSKGEITHDLLMVFGMAICIVPLGKLVLVLYALFVSLVLFRVPFFSWFFSLRIMRFLGDISYSVYLSHYFVLTPVVYLLIKHTNFVALHPGTRFAIGACLILPSVFLLSYLIYRSIELPFIRWGKSVIGRQREQPRPAVP